MPASSIRRHLQATSLLAVLAGYVVLLGVNRELSGRLRYDRHVAQAEATREVLERLAPADVDTPAELLETAARLCLALGTDGLRGELTLVRSARALAALEGASSATLDHLRAIAPSVLRHRLRRDPLDESSADIRVERVITELFDGAVDNGRD